MSGATCTGQQPKAPSTMFQFITLRILKGALTFLAAITVTFLIVRLMPGDPTTAFMMGRLKVEGSMGIAMKLSKIVG